MRWIDAHPFISEGREMILLNDVEGIMEESLIVSKDVLFLISLMDGSRSLRDIQAEYVRSFGELLYMEKLEEIVAAMDKNGLLLNDTYRALKARLQAEYDQAPVRPPACAGRSYSANRMDLLMTLDELCRISSEVTIGGDITGILAPHIDYGRGSKVYGLVYSHLRKTTRPLVVIFGTCHAFTEKIWNISLKDFETPLDVIPVGKELKGLIQQDALLKNYVDEWPHRREHSIELQLPFLQFNLQHDFEILPILTGYMHECIEGVKDVHDPIFTQLIDRLRGVLAAYGKPYIVVAGADLAHIGAQFGDPYPLDAMTLSISKVKDEELLASVKEVSAESFFSRVKTERDARRICGLAPIYFLLRFMEGSAAQIVGYDQWTDGRSSVSFAGAVFST